MYTRYVDIYILQKEMTALHFAAMNGHDEVIMTLIKNGANIDAQNCVSIYQTCLLLLLPFVIEIFVMNRV